MEFSVERESFGENRVPRGDGVNESEAFFGGALDVVSDGEDVWRRFQWSEKWLEFG